ncbi:MAG: hypothetical protein [Bacteriophage sp.]|nr:MAG: hypothetical protein [Bacteriophage sp.]
MFTTVQNLRVGALESNGTPFYFVVYRSASGTHHVAININSELFTCTEQGDYNMQNAAIEEAIKKAGLVGVTAHDIVDNWQPLFTNRTNAKHAIQDLRVGAIVEKGRPFYFAVYETRKGGVARVWDSNSNYEGKHETYFMAIINVIKAANLTEFMPYDLYKNSGKVIE